jgi:hypothetical protein
MKALVRLSLEKVPASERVRFVQGWVNEQPLGKEDALVFKPDRTPRFQR